MRLPDFIAAMQGMVMGLLPGKPFSMDNYRSLTIDSVCTQDGCAQLGIRPVRMAGTIRAHLSGHTLQHQLDQYRRSADGRSLR
jgi:NADH dehydrogenase